jgi:hypothetical protein
MGIRRWRFLVKCCVCNAEISFKTDPKSTDYEIEYGAVRNFEVWKDNDAAVQQDEEARDQEDADAMKSLENRTLDSKLEMDVLDTLDEIKAMNQRHERVDTEAILRQREERAAQVARGGAAGGGDLSAADEALVKATRFRALQPKTLLSDDEDDAEDTRPVSKSGGQSIDIFHAVQVATSQRAASARAAPVLLIKKKKRKVTAAAAAVAVAGAPCSTKAAGGNSSNNSDSNGGGNAAGGVVCPHGGKKARLEHCVNSNSHVNKPKQQEKSGLGGLIMGYGSSSDED